MNLIIEGYFRWINIFMKSGGGMIFFIFFFGFVLLGRSRGVCEKVFRVRERNHGTGITFFRNV
jgi:hypothetical protein